MRLVKALDLTLDLASLGLKEIDRAYEMKTSTIIEGEHCIQRGNSPQANDQRYLDLNIPLSSIYNRMVVTRNHQVDTFEF